MTQINPNSRANEPIAIIGLGCRYPGGGDAPDKLWQLLINQVDAVSEIPADRVNLAPLYDPILAAPGKIASNQGGFLKNIDQFDAAFFGISPREANHIDPQQRLLLETTWEALEDAGLAPASLRDSQTGVYIGEWTNDYADQMNKASDDPNLYVTTGGGRYAASGRVSFFFGLQGPSLTVDTACSSSLVTVHLACQSLRQGEINLALAGGANLILEPTVSVGYSRSKMLSPDGRCKFGDARANGYVRSEGVGVVVLKRLSDAIADGDSIYAVVRGSAVNNDGRSSELLVAPGVGSQIKMLREAYRSAGVNPAQVAYVEAHGTGTPVGDPVELEALSTVLSENRDSANPCLVGSIKTNIGHTESASGVAGLIKTALALKYRTVPPSLHYISPNPKIPWGSLGMRIPVQAEPLPNKGPVYAGVNSFGITGTNAHLVLETAPELPSPFETPQPAGAYILPISAATPDALNALASGYQEFFKVTDPTALVDICYTAAVRRGHLPARMAVVGASPAELIEQITLELNKQTPVSPLVQSGTQNNIVFVFPGQGSQWLGMGRELLKQNSTFRQSLLRCDEAIQKWGGWSLLEQLALNETDPGYRLNEISVIQPALFAMEVALAETWQAFGIQPAAVIGHSMGEAAAAYIAGALTLEEAARVMCVRSQLMQLTSGQGAMAVVGLPYGEAEAAIRASHFESVLSIAVQNSQRSVVISGSPAALETLLEKLHADNVFCRLVKVDVASHSPQMDPIVPELVAGLDGIQPQAAALPFYSTVLQAICPGEALDAAYWGKNLRQPVRFSGTIQLLLSEQPTIFIEMSPHPILLGAIDEVSQAEGRPAYGIASIRRSQPELATLLGQLGLLYSLGYPVEWANLFPQGGKVVRLPAYPWQRERYWFETAGVSKQARPGAHQLLGSYLKTATGEHIWETQVGTQHFAYLNDHQVRGNAVFPAAAYLEMTLAAAGEVFGAKSVQIRDVAFKEALFLKAEDQLLQLVFSGDDSASAVEFSFFSQSQAGGWVTHTTGRLRVGVESRIAAQPALDETPNGRTAEQTQAAFYQAVAARGLEYGQAFQSIQQLAHTQTGIAATIKLPADLAAAKYRLHPVLLDACLQAQLFALPDTNQDTYLPAALDSLEVFSAPDLNGEFTCLVKTSEAGDQISGDFWLFNPNGQLVLAASGLNMQHVAANQSGQQDLFYRLDWQEFQLPPAITRPQRWLIFADQHGLGASLQTSLNSAASTGILVQRASQFQWIGQDCCQIDPNRPEDYARLIQELAQPVDQVVHLWNLEAKPEPAGDHLLSTLYLAQALAAATTQSAPRLTIITRGAQMQAGETQENGPVQTSAWGLGAVIANELPNLHCTRIDLDPTPAGGEADLLVQVLTGEHGEDQILLRQGRSFAARLAQLDSAAVQQAQQPAARQNDEKLPFIVQATQTGILDHLELTPVLRKPVRPGEVEIEVKATGLNFMNVLSALGMLPGYTAGTGPLGIECAGVICAVGKGVTAFAPGDEVAAIAFDSLASHAVTDARLVVKKPDFMSFEEAAAQPIAYLTVYYAFHYQGHLQAGERVLIHSATGGVGLAAVQMAQRIGAEIFATAGSPEKRAQLASLGIQHISDSRSLAFADDILRETNGEGVDMVLNSLAGAALTRGLEILKPYGRFMEIGKRDIYANSKIGLVAFQKNLSFFAIDLDRMSRERPALVGAMLREVFSLLTAREIAPLPVQAFPVSNAREAFRWMAQARHTGKVAITVDDARASLKLPGGMPPVHAAATYLITGGLGELGLAFAAWLAELGARNLVLVGRSQPSPAAGQAIDALRASGVNVVTAQADVSDLHQLEHVFQGTLASLPPLKGVIHAAGLLADATLPQMSAERFRQAYAPKAAGAWNLHKLTAQLPLDFFILFSSITATLGTPGQANYAAGNAFLDGLAHYRSAIGLPALSICWGPWSEIGMANQQANRGQRLAQQGIKSITPAQGLAALPLSLALDFPQVLVMPFDAGKWCAAQPGVARASLLKELQNQSPVEAVVKKPARKSIREELLAVEAGRQRRTAFENLLREQVSQVLSMPPARVKIDQALNSLGLDSLMAIELRNRLENVLSVSLPATMTWNYPTITTLVPFLAERMGLELETSQPAPAVVEAQPAPVEQNLNDLDDLNDDELSALLDNELSAIDEALKGSSSLPKKLK